MDYAIRAEGLVRRFGATTALAGVDLAVPTGTVFGLLGPNGAGKTTAVRVLATLLRADEGHATVGGYDVVRDAHQVRQLIGLTGQYASVDETLTGAENLLLIGRLLGLSRADAKRRARELLGGFHLSDAGDRAAKTYSGGMRRRLDLAASLVGRPQVLFLDEPTTGLDPRSRNELWDIVRTLVADGVTVLLTTQYLEEADQLAGEIAVVDHGRVIAQGTPEELKAKTGGQTLAVRPADLTDLATVVSIAAEVSGATPEVGPEHRHRRGERPRRAAGGGAPPRRRRDRGGRAGPARRQPGRGLPLPHRPPGRGRPGRHRPGKDPGMTAATLTAPLAPARRLGVAAGLRHTFTLAWRSLVQIKHNPMELLDLSIQPVMFVLLFTYVFGTAIAGSSGEYLTFVLPGIMVQNALFATMTTGSGSTPTSPRGSSTGSGPCRSPGGRRWPAGSSPTPSSRPGRSRCCSASG